MDICARHTAVSVCLVVCARVDGRWVDERDGGDEDEPNQTHNMSAIVTCVDGNLLHCDADVIVQQTNCLTRRPYGLSTSIKQRYGVDTYARRRGDGGTGTGTGTGNLARREDRGTPGTVTWSPVPRHSDAAAAAPDSRRVARRTPPPSDVVVVVGLVAQFAPGKPGVYYARQRRQHGVDDSSDDRRTWFRQSLAELGRRLRLLPPTTVNEEPAATDAERRRYSIAFPSQIGCGLAGGTWSVYRRMIDEWAATLPGDRFDVRIVRLRP
jgi:hypothetical protein